MTPKLPVITPKRLIRSLEKAGFFVHHQRGSHITMRHSDFPDRRVIIPCHSRDLKKGLLKGILKDAGLTAEDLRELL
ncbi:MAG: type II toxin-antitoxin system HicA family toxin [candidate division Zixibacteria bacterium]|nr:type II toxin-antitoxin system HicA family toxin [Candidatus Tariuqbacter arcticus]